MRKIIVCSFFVFSSMLNLSLADDGGGDSGASGGTGGCCSTLKSFDSFNANKQFQAEIQKHMSNVEQMTVRNIISALARKNASELTGLLLINDPCAILKIDCKDLDRERVRNVITVVKDDKHKEQQLKNAQETNDNTTLTQIIAFFALLVSLFALFKKK
jgi:hypothetical protein